MGSQPRGWFLGMLFLLVALQSPAMFTHGAACGSYATFGPDPVIAMQDLTITVSNTAQENGVVYHGNSDGTCLDGLSEFSTGTSTVTISRDQQMTMFRASNVYRMCQGGTELCQIARLIPVLNSRNGAWKPVATPPAASHLTVLDPVVNTPFRCYVFAGTTTFTDLRGVTLGFTMDVGLSPDRNCSTRNHEVLDAAVTWSASSLYVDFNGQPKGFYSLCLRLWRSGSVQADWHSTTSLLGDSTHNVAVGYSARPNWQWDVTNGVSGHLRYEEGVTIYIDVAVLTSDFTQFGVDTSGDVCGPAVRTDFVIGDLSAFNATHASATITVSRPYGSPAGGISALCGSLSTTAPWVRVSYSPGPWFHFCDADSGMFLSSNDRFTCTYCSPNSSMPCHDNGDCAMTFEDKTDFMQSQSCSCYDRFYGSLCEWYDLDAPTFSEPNGTYRRETMLVQVFAPTNDGSTGVNVTYGDGTTLHCWIKCDLYLTGNNVLSTYSTHVNGSRSLDVAIATYWLNPRTPTTSLTVTCGDVAMFGDPPLAMRQDPWTVTVVDPYYNNLVIHGNNDLSCLDSYNILGTGSSRTITQEDEWMRFHGSQAYHVCQNGIHVCSKFRLLPVRSSNSAGVWRPNVLPEAPISWTGGPGIPFSVLVFSGDNDFTVLRSVGYTFDFALSRHRNCTTKIVTYLDSSIIFLGAGAFFSVTSKPMGLYSVCVRVSVSSVVAADWAPVSAMLGHTDGNINLGFLRAASPNWTATAVNGSVLRFGQQVTLVVDQDIQGSGMVYFAIDTGAHVCSTFLNPHFTVSDLVAINATHWEVNTTVERPYGQPGGGQGILCGAFGIDEPWALMSPIRGEIFYECDLHGGIWRTDLNTCVYCSANEATPMCNNHGSCNITREDKTQLLQEMTTCTCDDRFYGTYCEYYRLDPPVFSLPNGTYKTRSVLEVNVTTTNPDTEGIHLTFGNGTTYACPSTCLLRFFENVTVTTYAFHTNGSVSVLSTAWYNLIDPTWTLSHTETELVALSPTKTISPTESLTEEHTWTLTQKQTRSQNTKSESLEICKLLNPSVTTVYLLEPDWTETVGPFTGSCTPCSTVCSAGLRLNCSALTLEVLHVAPEQHWCNMTAGVATFHWNVYIAPRRPRQTELSTRTEPVAVEVNSKYLPINVPYMARGLEWTYKKCGSDRAINISTSMFNMLPSDTNTACFDVNVSGSGFTNATGSVSGPAARLTTSAKAKAEESINSASDFTEIVLFTKNWAFYLIALAVGIEFLVLFLVRAKRRWSMRPTTEESDEL